MNRRALPWVALVAALSPVLFEMLVHSLEFRWAAVWLVFAVLFFVLEARSPVSDSSQRLRVLGRFGLILTAIVVVVFVGGREPRLARLSVPLGLASMACLLGRPPQRAALLSLWVLPLPSRAADLLGPGLGALWIEGASWVVPGARALAPVGQSAPALGFTGEASRLFLHSGFNGIALTWALAGVGVFHCVRRDPGAAWLQIARTGLFYACWGLPAQALGIVCAGWAFAASHSLPLAQGVLDWGWLVPIGIAVWWGFARRSGLEPT